MSVLPLRQRAPNFPVCRGEVRTSTTARKAEGGGEYYLSCLLFTCKHSTVISLKPVMMAKRSLRKSSKRLIYPQRELVLCLVSGFQLRCYPLPFGKAITPCYTLINFKTWEPEVLFSLFSHFTCAETSLNFTFFWPMLILPLWNKNSALWRWVFHSSPLIKSLESLKQAASPSKNTWGFREIQLLLPSHSSIDFYDIPSSF